MTDTWQVDNDIVNGLNDTSIGYYTLPEVFLIGEDVYLISSSTSNVFYGFKLNIGSWISDSSIVNGLPSGVSRLAATVFNLEGNDYAIIGDNNGAWTGRKWNGSSWDNQPSIVSGLPPLGPPYDNTPSAFYMNNELCLIYMAGVVPTHLKGFKWNGSTWIEDTSIVSGISIPANASYRASVFLYDSKLKLILARWSPAAGEGGPFRIGYSREGSTWVIDNVIISGLTELNYILGGDTLTKDGNIYFFAGDWYGLDVLNFYGFKIPVPRTVTNITSTNTNGVYRTGQTIAITIQFDGVVTVTGTPQLQLETGITDEQVDYSSGSGSDTLTFNYTIQAGDISSDLDYVSTNSFTLNGGTIKDAGSNDANLILPTPGAAGSLGANKNIIIATALLYNLKLGKSFASRMRTKKRKRS